VIICSMNDFEHEATLKDLAIRSREVNLRYGKGTIGSAKIDMLGFQLENGHLGMLEKNIRKSKMFSLKR